MSANCPNCSPSGDYERVELVWPGKGKPVEQVRLPFQTIERVNDVRRSRGGQAELGRHLKVPPGGRSVAAVAPPPFRNSTGSGGQTAETDAAPGNEPRVDPETGRTDLPDWWPAGWRNRLIWGDNRLVLSSLLEEFAGKVDLIYIDPPFATGADFSYKITVAGRSIEKRPSVYETAAFRDTWGKDGNGFAHFLHQRLVLLRDLLNPDHGSIFLRLDYREGFKARAIMDEVFGARAFRNEIAVSRTRTIKAETGRFHHATDALYFYSNGPDRFSGFRKELPKKEWAWIPMHMVGERVNKDLLTVTIGGRKFTAPRGRRWILSQAGFFDAWERGLIRIDEDKDEPLFHKKQVTIGSNWTDTPGYSKRHDYPTENHESILERVITSSSQPGDLVLDCFVGSGTSAAVSERLERRWIAADIGRFAIHTTRKRLLNIPGCRPFEVRNVGSYERKHWQGFEAQGNATNDSLRDYVKFVLRLYNAEPKLGQFREVHGFKEGRAVHVGATEAPVSWEEINVTVESCRANGITKLDILGWEFEMGVNSEFNGREGGQRHFDEVAVRKFLIPREIMDKRNVDAKDINFFELSVARAELIPEEHDSSRKVRVHLTDYIPRVDQYMEEKLTAVPTKWSDWIDYWSVDFEYDGEVFINQWQAYRTRQDRSLALESDPHTYETLGAKIIVVKIIDIFGNDTTLRLEHGVAA